MSTAASPSRRSEAGGAPAFLIVLLLVAASLPAATQERRLAYLNEKLPVPDSERFNEARYTDTGVGLGFGVDLQLTYLSGQYGEAVRRFEKAVGQYPHKSDIWVYLSRAYFYLNQPDQARQALKRAAEAMPDLDGRLWAPLVRGLEWEIRQRAAQLKVQIDFYARGTNDFLRLYRLYLFLQDYDEARKVVRAADARAEAIEARATAMVGAKKEALRDQAAQWRDLGEQLRAELGALGQTAPDPVPAPDTGRRRLQEEAERLQRAVDFYPASIEQYERLFGLYLQLADRAAADSVRAAVGRRRRVVQSEITSAATLQEEAQLQDKLTRFNIALQGMRLKLEEAP